MKKSLQIPFVLIFPFLLIGCSTAPTSSPSLSGGNPSVGSGSTSDGSGDTTLSNGTIVSSGSAEQGESYASFWDYGESLALKLVFSNASLYALSTYGAQDSSIYYDVYFPADLTITSGDKTYSYPEVGVRMKGNNSRAEIVNSDGSFKAGAYCHFKVSFKCTFDDTYYDLSAFSAFKHDWSSDSAGRSVRKKRNFAGMEKLDLKYLPRNAATGSSAYQTYSQDIYCYDVFNKMNVQAPRSKWASVTLNDGKGSKVISYEAVEAMDACFVKHHFPSDSGGDLYKCSTYAGASQGSYIKADLTRSGAVALTSGNDGKANGARVANGKIGVEDNYTDYHPNYQLKTNDDGENSDFSKMAALINTIDDVETGKSNNSALEKVLDVQEFLQLEAVSYCLGNFDDQRNNYNNYFIYFRPSDGKAVYIPYDWDWSLGACLMIDVTSWAPYHTKTSHDSSSTNPLYWCTIFSNSSLTYSITSYRNTYATTIKALVNAGYLTYATYTSFVSALQNLGGRSEFSSVSSYMSSKSSVISSSSLS
jgi:hypothetical protein